MSNQSSVEWLLNEIKRRVAIIQSEPATMARELMIDNLAIDLRQAKSTHESESIDFALFVLCGEKFNQFPEATKQYLREKVRKEYNKFFEL